jgi:acyl-CoA thioester hydrolase
MENHPHSLDFSVRDYECDLQGVVNNAVYMNYLEHARHTFLLEQNIDFAALSSRGTNLVVVRAELIYRASLRSGDQFRITTSIERTSRLKCVFHQRIEKLPDLERILDAEVTGTALNSENRPEIPLEIDRLIPFQKKG